jgi:hypothetical protein
MERGHDDEGGILSLQYASAARESQDSFETRAWPCPNARFLGRVACGKNKSALVIPLLASGATAAVVATENFVRVA